MLDREETRVTSSKFKEGVFGGGCVLIKIGEIVNFLKTQNNLSKMTGRRQNL
jgi:hypothetical protein